MSVPALLLALLATSCASARAGATGGGLSSARLQNLTSLVREEVRKGVYPGAVLVVARDGKVVLSEAFGTQDPVRGTPMRTDSIFRIASMTKPIVSVGVLMLVEEGKVGLGDPAWRYVAELKGLKVGVEKKDAAGAAVLEEVPAQREMTVQDLLRHTSGLTYGYFGDTLVDRKYRDANLGGDPAMTGDDFIRRLVALPLVAQPGKAWVYSRSTDVLGLLLERVSGQSLDVFLAERILRPLGMASSGFFVEPSEHGRIAEPFAVDPETKAKADVPDVRTRPRFMGGGAGMVSTAGDYARFCQMLLNGGELDGVRILSRKSVELMTSDALPPGASMPWPGNGFGLGVSVRTSQGIPAGPGSVGQYGWSGYYGTTFLVDPRERLVAVWLVQRGNFWSAMATWARYAAVLYSALE